VDPEAREKLLAGNINVFNCKCCGYSAEITANLMYHDISREFVVQYYPPEKVDDISILSQFTREGYHAEVDKYDYDPEGAEYFRRLHVVFDMSELVRYIRFKEALAKFHERRLCRENGESDDV
jgi:hypothetical protein